MKTILVPTDFSQPSDNAVIYAVELAEFFEANLVLVHATLYPIGSHETVLPIEMMSDMLKNAKRDLENLKNELLAKPHKKLSIECYAEMGYAYDIIKDATELFHADLVVMGIIGEAGKIKEHIFGSTAVRVAQQSKVPVFIIPENVTYQPIRKISFACDLDKTEESFIIHMVKYFAKLFDAQLEVINVEQPGEEFTTEKAKSNLFIEKKLQTVDHKTVFITDTQVAKALEDYFISHPTDLVLLNPKEHTIFHNLFNESVTKELAFHLRSPILAVH